MKDTYFKNTLNYVFQRNFYNALQFLLYPLLEESDKMLQYLNKEWFLFIF